MAIKPEPQPPVEQIMRSDAFRQRIYVKAAMDAADWALPPHLAKMVKSELDSNRCVADWLGVPHGTLLAASDILEMAKNYVDA